MKRISLLAFCLILSPLALSGCSGAPKNKDAAPAATQSAEKPKAKVEPAKAAPVAKESSGASAANEVRCEASGDQRVIAVAPKDEGCELQYTKAGQMSVIATANTGTEHCAEVQGRIKQKLEAAGFGCQ